jgi:Flp pilus assembly protein TadG
VAGVIAHRGLVARDPLADPKRYTRMAGALYLVIIVAGIVGPLLTRESLVVPHDAVATARNIAASPELWRVGISLDLVAQLCDVPVMLILFVGLIDVANLLSANRRVTLTASTLGDLVTQAHGEVSTADLKGFFSAARPIMDPFPASSTSLELYTFTRSGGSVKLDWTYKSAGANCGVAPQPDDTMINLMAEGNDVVVSRTCYAWEPLLGIIIGLKTSTVQDQLMLRPRQSARITCKGCS